MAQTSEMLQLFTIPGVLAIDRGKGGLTRLSITAEPASAEIYLHGAHITQFQPRGAAPLLFMSNASLFRIR